MLSMLQSHEACRFNEKIKNNESRATKLITGVNGNRKQKWQSLNVRDTRCPLNISSFNICYVPTSFCKEIK